MHLRRTSALALGVAALAGMALVTTGVPVYFAWRPKKMTKSK